jgi:hypothetical protein
MKRILIIAIVLISIILPINPVEAQTSTSDYEYLFPIPGAKMLNPETNIIVRFGQEFTPEQITRDVFLVVGSKSGVHKGKTVLSDDNETIVFQPEKAFQLGENVSVTIKNMLSPMDTIQTFFMISSFEKEDSVKAHFPDMLMPLNSGSVDKREYSILENKSIIYKTLPFEFLDLDITIPGSGPTDSYIFTALWPWYFGPDPLPWNRYLVIMNDNGIPVYIEKNNLNVVDFKKQPNGNLTFYSNSENKYFVLNQAYQIIDTIQSGNGYPFLDMHELQILPNGHILLMIYDYQPVDMSTYGGQNPATVVGLVIQELDLYKNVVFEWRSWDHIPFTDSYVDLTTSFVDYIHGNAIELDHDENLLVSNRNTQTIIKIDHNTGDVLWILGGKQNDFTFVNDDGFSYQHDIRRLINGNITLFDNRTNALPAYSRAVEYAIDEENFTITKIWEYINPYNTYGAYMGNVQRLPNGHTLIGWGSGPSANPNPVFENITEVEADGTKVFEMSAPSPYVSYRSFRYEWHAIPFWNPKLIVENNTGETSLYFSWNGATDIIEYKVYGGTKNIPIPNTLLATVTKSNFEDSWIVPDGLEDYCYFRVMPIDQLGREMKYSDIVTNTKCFKNNKLFLPLIVK